jgi:putative oxygen-independent coproporphyrinogen III oxidase
VTSAVAAPIGRWLAAPVESGPAAGFGIYLHVPFCEHRCGYCDFATYALDDRGHLMGRYVTALREEVRLAAELASEREVTSIYVGGGTPTVLPGDDLAGVLRLVHERFEVLPDAEVTVEANPETADPAAFGALAAAGVNRMSLGAQSFAPHVLETLERLHDPDLVPTAVAMARDAGIEQVNVDLIYGTPGEAERDWEASLRRVLALGVDHVSAYALTLAANTPLARHVAEGRLPPPDPDLQRERFDHAREVLGEAGFEHYEVSNWARGPTRRSRHNTLYWRHGDYLGLGVGAHGHHAGHRTWQHRSIERWLGDVEEGRRPVGGEEHLDIGERASERLLLGLRLREGLHPIDVPPLDEVAVQEAVDSGLLELTCGRFQASTHGWYLLDELLRRLATRWAPTR